ncbi:RHS repeat-associated core domain-containing protein [Streptomyces sp. NPDC090493]|uniref:RHS repeat-associated core domain-containing protein n=1 Tax=Streptomyces sp. NPDC090493 TaxID=3365964 RepID=UPI00381ADE7C
MAGYRPADWHPLDLDKDPTPGDPQRVRTLATQLHAFADDVSDALGLVKGMAGEDTLLQWAGKSAEVFKEQFKDVPKNLKKLKKSYELCGDALADYWPKLERAQALADKALAKAKDAQSDLSSAKSRLSSADSWVTRATKEADKYKDDPTGSKSDADKPDEGKVRAATRDVQSAKSAHTQAQSDVTTAQSALDAAKKMAEDARRMRDDAAGEAKRKIDEASDAGIPNRHWWQDVGHWFEDNWDTIVTVCKVVVAVVGIIAMIIGGPILGAIVLVAALVVLADTLYKYSQGQASLWDVAFAALDCIPGGKGITSLGKLAKGMRGLGKLGLKGMAEAVRGLGTRGLTSLRSGMTDLVARGKALAGRCPGGDPIDLVSGEMLMVASDVTLPGILPLEVKRTYLSTYNYGRWFGPSWASTLDERLEMDDQGIAFASDDGMLLAYPRPTPGDPVYPLEGPRWPLEWDGKPGGPMTIMDPETGVTRVFQPDDAPGADGSTVFSLHSRSDRNGHRLDIEYSAAGEPVALHHSGGYRVAIETEAGRIASLRLAEAIGSDDATLVRYAYRDGDLVHVYNSSGLPFRYAYDDRGRITRWEDRCGSWYEFEYDEEDRCVRGAGADGFLDCRLTYDRDARRTVYSDSSGQATVHEYNERLQRTAVIDALGNITRYEWDRRDRLVGHTDALGNSTRYAYDAAGNLVNITSADGTTARAEFNEQRLPTLTEAADGSCWSYAYDDRGNRTSVTTPLAETTRFAYDGKGALTEITDPAGAVTRVETDARGLPVKSVDPLGGTVQHTRDAFGRVSEIRDALGNVTRLTWNVEGKPLSRTTPDGGREVWEWDAEGRLVRHTDSAGSVTRFGYTHFDLPAWRSDADGGQRHFRYDTELRLVGVTNEQGLAWEYRFGTTGLLESETDFNGRTLIYSYDAAGRLARRTNGAGQVTSYERDAVGRVVGKRTAESSTTYSYTSSGQVYRARCGDVVVEAERDRLGRVLSETTNGRTISHAYDRLGRRTVRRTPSGAESRWEYSKRSLPSRLSSAGHEIVFRHDEDGKEVVRDFGDSLRMERHWDECRRMTSHVLRVPDGHGLGAESPVVSRRDYVYGIGDRLTETRDLHGGRQQFRHDERGRVVAVDGDSWQERYAYDAAGNPTSSSSSLTGRADGEQARHTYAGNQVRRAGRRSYTYDGQGRVNRLVQRTLSGGRRAWSFSWDADDRLTGMTGPDGRRWSYDYDPFGRRTEKRCHAEDGQVIERTAFTWDGQRLAEQSRWSDAGEHTVTWEYEPGTHRPMAQAERTRSRELPQDEVDERFFAIVTDVVGTPVELIGLDGAVRWRGRSGLWGDEDAPDTAVSGGLSCPLRFPGQYADEESGLHYNFHRYYDPHSVRFLTPDPLGLQAGPDHYAYVSNPHLWVDPLGLQRCPTFVGIQWMTDKMLQRVSFRYQRFVTHTDYEQVWRLGDGREVHVDGGPTADGFIVEAKWTGGDHPGEWAASQYNPAHRHYDEDRITSQAEKLLALNEGLGGKGVRYATSYPEGAEHLRDLFSSKFPDEFADGRLNVFHVPGNGMD